MTIYKKSYAKFCSKNSFEWLKVQRKNWKANSAEKKNSDDE